MNLDYGSYQESLSKVSKDDAGNSLIKSEQQVCNFDRLTEAVAGQYRAGKPVCSSDALYIRDDQHLYLIEFKNAKSSNIPKKSLKLKAYDSIMTLQCALYSEYSLDKLKTMVTFVFVYNNACGDLETNDSFEKLKKKVKEFTSGKELILFGLDIYKDVFYKEVFTVDKEQFESVLMPEIFNSGR